MQGWDPLAAALLQPSGHLYTLIPYPYSKFSTSPNFQHRPRTPTLLAPTHACKGEEDGEWDYPLLASKTEKRQRLPTLLTPAIDL
jgi:hypothetical protein